MKPFAFFGTNKNLSSIICYWVALYKFRMLANKQILAFAMEALDKQDRIRKSQTYRVWNAEESVKLRLEGTETEFPPISVPTFVRNKCQEFEDCVALVSADRSTLTYGQYYEMILSFSKALIHFGLDRYHSVCVLSFNSAEWFIAAVAAIFAGGFANGLYLTNNDETNAYILNDCKANIVVCEDENAAGRVSALKGAIPTLKRVVQCKNRNDGQLQGDVVSFESLLKIGRQLKDEILADRLAKINVNDCSALVYTSGTTGPPKGVMLSHDNVLFMARMLNKVQKSVRRSEVFMSYLPLSHIAGFFSDIFTSMDIGAQVHFPPQGVNVLKGRRDLGEALRLIRPTLMFGTPRIYEKIQETLNEEEAVDLKRVGFERMKACFTSGAPMKKHTKNFFREKCGIRIYSSYGMSETTGIHLHTFSPALSGESQLKKMDEYPNCVGSLLIGGGGKSRLNGAELEMWGRNIMMGYVNNEVKTRQVLSVDGWLKSGDVFTIDEDKVHFITGRIKELLITSGGENVSPVPIEEAIMTQLSEYLTFAVAVGDGKKFISALLVAKEGVECEAELISDGISKANEKAPNNVAKVKKWVLLEKVRFSVEGGELSPTLKLKRSFIHEKYKESIDKIYEFIDA